MVGIMLVGAWLLIHHQCCVQGDPSSAKATMIEPLIRRSPLEKNFMRFGRSWSPDKEDKTPDQDSAWSTQPSQFALTDPVFPFKLYKGFYPYFRTRKSYQDKHILKDKKAQDNFIRFGRSGDKLFRMTKSKDNFMRFGRSEGDDEDDMSMALNTVLFSRLLSEDYQDEPEQGDEGSEPRAKRSIPDAKVEEEAKSTDDPDADHLLDSGPLDRETRLTPKETQSPKDFIMRFDRAGDNFMRFGRAKDNFIRFGRDSDGNFMRPDRGGNDNNFMRFGRGNENFMRFGRGNDNNFMRFGRGKDNFMRFGRGNENFMRFGRAKDNFMRFGRAKDNFMRFGRAKDNFMRFGRAKDNFMRFGRAKDNFMRFGRAKDNFMRFGRGKDNFMRFGRLLNFEKALPEDEYKTSCTSDNTCAEPNTNIKDGLMDLVRQVRSTNENFIRFGKSGKWDLIEGETSDGDNKGDRFIRFGRDVGEEVRDGNQRGTTPSKLCTNDPTTKPPCSEQATATLGASTQDRLHTSLHRR